MPNTDLLEVEYALRVMRLQSDGSARWIDQPLGAGGGSFCVFWFGVVDRLLVVEKDLNAFAFDAKANVEPLRFVDRRFGQVVDEVQTAGLTFFDFGTVELNFIALVQVLLLSKCAIRVEEDAGIGVPFGTNGSG